MSSEPISFFASCLEEHDALDIDTNQYLKDFPSSFFVDSDTSISPTSPQDSSAGDSSGSEDALAVSPNPSSPATNISRSVSVDSSACQSFPFPSRMDSAAAALNSVGSVNSQFAALSAYFPSVPMTLSHVDGKYGVVKLEPTPAATLSGNVNTAPRVGVASAAPAHVNGEVAALSIAVPPTAVLHVPSPHGMNGHSNGGMMSSTSQSNCVNMNASTGALLPSSSISSLPFNATELQVEFTGDSSSHGSPTTPSLSTPGAPVDVDTIRELLKEQDVKKYRLARKAELARMSRKRKKMRMNDLEDEVDRLKDELERAHKRIKVAEDKLCEAQQQQQLLQQQQQAAPAPAVSAPAAAPPIQAFSSNLPFSPMMLEEENRSLHSAIRNALYRRPSNNNDNGSEEEVKIPAMVDNLVNVFKKQNMNALSQLTTMRDHMEIALPLRFLEWAMHQSDKFFNDPSGLWASLCHREIGLSASQLERLMSLRCEMQSQRSSASDVEMAYNQFKSCMETHLSQAETNLARVVDIFSPEQLAKFFSWVDQFGSVCVKINV